MNKLIKYLNSSSLPHDRSQQKHPYGKNILQSCDQEYEQEEGKRYRHRPLSSVKLEIIKYQNWKSKERQQ